MGRIQKAYENRFRALLGQLKARRLEQGVQWLARRAAALGRASEPADPRALADVCEHTRQQVQAWRSRRGRAGPAPVARSQDGAPPTFLCDAGLGGLARWLRAAGYEAHWRADWEDDLLLQEARRLGAVLLTTDSLLLERRLLRERVIPSLWIAPARGARDQLATVLRELGLSRREPRCMKCGGPLTATSKEAVLDRIPPRTRRWLDTYFVCARCGQLFWWGTHWQRIEAALATLQPPPPRS